MDQTTGNNLKMVRIVKKGPSETGGVLSPSPRHYTRLSVIGITSPQVRTLVRTIFNQLSVNFKIMEKSKIYPAGLVIVSVLQIIFLALHFAGTITWSWAAVLSPLWIAGAVILVVSILLRVLRSMASGSSSGNSK